MKTQVNVTVDVKVNLAACITALGWALFLLL
jgi:hypothetical protein